MKKITDLLNEIEILKEVNGIKGGFQSLLNDEIKDEIIIPQINFLRCKI